MLFNTWAFAWFCPIVVLTCYALPWRWRNPWLLAASYFFYGCWDWRFLLLLSTSILVDFNCARRLARTTEPRRRKRLLGVSLAVNLGILGFFKYFGFFVDSAAAVLHALGWPADLPRLHIILPVGISFYTFQTLSYTIGVYRGDTKPTDSLIDFALFVSFFPQLVAGPIERAGALLPQLQTPRQVTWFDLREGLLLILLGLFRKMAVADVLSPLVEQCFANPAARSGADLLYGLYLFSIQIYCDFSGYSSIARGAGKLLGVNLMVNFRQPYFALSVTEFWHRWHISLSTWLRDHLYIPLGGNRHGVWRTYRNLMLTMLLGGLWHGAAWTFVVWGGLHGLFLAVARLASGGRREALARPWWRRLLAGALTFHLVALTWIFFRAPDFQVAWQYLTGILTWQAGSMGGLSWLDPDVVVPLAVLLLLDVPVYRSDDDLVFLRWSPLARGLLYTVVLLVLMVWGSGRDNAPFIYFQF